MIDDSPKSKQSYLTEEDANLLASLLMGDPAPGPVIDITNESDLLLDLTDSPTLTFDPDKGMADMLSGATGTRVSDLVDVPLALGAKPSAAVIARSVFGQPEPGSVVVLPRSTQVRAKSVTAGAAANGVSQGWFRPTSEAPAYVSSVRSDVDLFARQTLPVEQPVTVRLETAADGGVHDAVVFTADSGPADRRRIFLLAALFLGALLVGGGLVALFSDNTLLNRNNDDPAVVTTVSPATTAPVATLAPTTAAPTTAAPATVAPTTAAPTTTIAPTTTVPETTTEPPTTAAPTTTSPPTTQAPRTTRRPATTRPPATPAPTTAAPTVTFAPPTWAEPLE